jgi:hypothetical protein
MAKRPTNDGEQLSLDLEFKASLTAEIASPKSLPKNHNVVGFVDASTRDARRDAIRRVQRSGIFPAPSDPRFKA